MQMKVEEASIISNTHVALTNTMDARGSPSNTVLVLLSFPGSTSKVVPSCVVSLQNRLILFTLQFKGEKTMNTI